MASIWGLVAKIIPTLSSLNIDVINFVKSNTLVNDNLLNDILKKMYIQYNKHYNKSIIKCHV